jgi:hypothetical protein
VVVALADERLSVVLGRLRAVGGFATLFVKGNRRVRIASVVDTSSAIGTPADMFTGDDVPGATATVGIFLDYVERNPSGVAISAAVGHPACARDARTVEFAGSPS